jgi:hypothetical protein
MDHHHDAKLISLELRFLVDRVIAAKQDGMPDAADAFIRVAEKLLRSALPVVANDIARIASRKGKGEVAVARMTPLLSPTAAAAIVVIWSFRGARQPAIHKLDRVFAACRDYQETVRLLCHRLFAQPRTTPTPTAIEVAAPRSR